MNDTTTREQLSALLDGELPRDELRFLLRRLERDTELSQRWSRYQLIGQTLKRERALQFASDRFAAAVMRRLDEQVELVAGVPIRQRILRWAGGGAIAASVAVVALLASRPPADDPSVANATAMAASAAPTAEQRAASVPQQQLLPAGFADYAQPASFESIVPNYVPRNSGSQLINGLPDGFVPYVLVVGSRQVLEPQPGAARQEPAAKQ